MKSERISAFTGKRTISLLIGGAIIIALLAALSWWEGEAQSAAAVSLEVRFSHPPGEYAEDIFLEITTAHPDAQIYFTLDGRIPDPAVDQTVISPIHLTADPPQVVTVRALAALPDGTTGPVKSSTYFRNLDTTLSKLNIIVDPDD